MLEVVSFVFVIMIDVTDVGNDLGHVLRVHDVGEMI